MKTNKLSGWLRNKKGSLARQWKRHGYDVTECLKWWDLPTLIVAVLLLLLSPAWGWYILPAMYVAYFLVGNIYNTWESNQPYSVTFEPAPSQSVELGSGRPGKGFRGNEVFVASFLFHYGCFALLLWAVVSPAIWCMWK